MPERKTVQETTANGLGVLVPQGLRRLSSLGYSVPSLTFKILSPG